MIKRIVRIKVIGSGDAFLLVEREWKEILDDGEKISKLG